MSIEAPRKGQILSYKKLYSIPTYPPSSGTLTNYEVDIAGCSKHKILTNGQPPTQTQVDDLVLSIDNPAAYHNKMLARDKERMDMLRRQKEEKEKQDRENRIKSDFLNNQRTLAMQYKLERENKDQVRRQAFSIKRLSNGIYVDVRDKSHDREAHFYGLYM